MKKTPFFGQYPEWHSMPLRLTKAEMEKPSEVLQTFIKDYDLQLVRQNFQEMFNCIFMTKPADLLQYVWFREKVERFIEATYVAEKQRESVSTVPNYLEFLAVISHELQNQLAGMTNIVTTLEDYKEEGGGYSNNATEYIEMMKAALTNARTVYDSIQTTTKITVGGISITPSFTQVNLSQLFDDLLLSLLPLEYVQGNKLIFRSQIEPDTEGRTDVSMLRQIITNLILNAFKYSKPQRCIRIKGVIDKEFLKVRVQNMGQYIPKAVQGRLFEPFFVAEKGKAGNGLGLYICKLYCLALGGDIKLRSSTTGITILTVQLPIK